MYYTTLGDYVRILLHVTTKEAKASNDVRLLASCIVNMVSSKVQQPSEIWKIPIIDNLPKPKVERKPMTLAQDAELRRLFG